MEWIVFNHTLLITQNKTNWEKNRTALWRNYGALELARMKRPRSLGKANESRQVHQPPWIFCSRQSAITCNKGPGVSLSTVLQKWKIHTKNYEGDWIWVAKIMEKGNHNEAWYFALHFVSKHLLLCETRGQERGIRWGPADYTGFSTTSQCWEGGKM